jgi:hypothetical protein
MEKGQRNKWDGSHLFAGKKDGACNPSRMTDQLFFFFFGTLVYEAVSISDYIASNGKMTGEL